MPDIDKNLIKTLVEFHAKSSKLKTTLRHSWLPDGNRQESVADHSWMLCLLAMLMFDEIGEKVDLLKVMKMLTIHDLAESVVGDIPSHEISARQDNKVENEREALTSLVSSLPKEKGDEILALWEEVEARETIESKFANALDKAEAIMQHNVSDITLFSQGDFDVHPYYKDNYFDFDAFIRAFKDFVDVQSMEKIIGAGAESRIDPKFLERYKKTK